MDFLDWSDADRAVVEAAIKPLVPEHHMDWLFWTYPGGGFGAKRATWDMETWYAEMAQELAAKIAAYYAR